MDNYADSIRSAMPQFYPKNTSTRSTEAIGRQEPLTNAGRTLRVDLSSRAGPVGHASASASAVSQQQRPIETRTVSFNNTSGDRTTAETVSVYFRETLTEKLNALLSRSESNSHNIQDMRDELFRFRNEFMNTHRATDRLNSKLSTLSNKMHLIETDTRRLLEEVNLRAKDLEILTDKIGIDLLTAVDTTTDLEKTIKQIQSSKEDRTALKIHVSYLSMMADRLQKEKNRLLNDIDKLLTSNDGELKERVAKAKEALAKDECAESATTSHRESEDKTLWQRLKGLCFKRKFTICGVVGIPGGLSGAAVIYGIYLVVKGRECFLGIPPEKSLLQFPSIFNPQDFSFVGNGSLFHAPSNTSFDFFDHDPHLDNPSVTSLPSTRVPATTTGTPEAECGYQMTAGIILMSAGGGLLLIGAGAKCIHWFCKSKKTTDRDVEANRNSTVQTELRTRQGTSVELNIRNETAPKAKTQKKDHKVSETSV